MNPKTKSELRQEAARQQFIKEEKPKFQQLNENKQKRQRIGQQIENFGHMVTGTLQNVGMNVPFDALRDFGVKVPITFFTPTAYTEAYGKNLTFKDNLNELAKGVAIVLGAGIGGKAIVSATPVVRQFIKHPNTVINPITRKLEYTFGKERPLTPAEIRLKNIQLAKNGILPEQKTLNLPYKNIIHEGVYP
mgnify:CR=1 FL=1